MGRSRKIVRNSGMAAKSSQFPKGERAKQKGQLGVRDGDIFRDPRYFPCAPDHQSMWERDHKGTVQPKEIGCSD